MPDWMTAEELINAGYNIGNISLWESNLVSVFVRYLFISIHVRFLFINKFKRKCTIQTDKLLTPNKKLTCKIIILAVISRVCTI